MIARKRVFSGIQPTGKITIGNYLGAIKNWAIMQNQYECLFCIADLHALTLNFDAMKLRNNIQYAVAFYVAAGLDPEKVIIFQQSKIPEHSELAWILSCLTQIGSLNRMTQFKNKIADNKKNVNLGLYSYPVLMAADILLYNTNIVPAGEDQKQHIELVRDIATSFNKKVGKRIFIPPDIIIEDKAKRIMNLKNAHKKMSKSDSSDFSRINTSDEASLIRKKIYKAKTDNIKGIGYDIKQRPEIVNLIKIYSCFSNTNIQDVVNNYRYFKHYEFKKLLANIIVDIICPMHQKALAILKKEEYIKHIMTNGIVKAKIIAKKSINQIKQAIGIH